VSATNLGTPPVQEDGTDIPQWVRRIAKTLNTVIAGKVNCTIDVTLNAGVTTTTVNDARIFYTSAIIPAMALTYNGATDIAGGIYVPLATIKKGQAVIYHRADIATDRTIRFVILG